MLEKEHPLSIRNQCDLLMINRSRVYYQPKVSEGNETIIANRIHEIWHELPFYGYRRITALLQREGHEINHKKVSRLMRSMNIEALYPKPNCSKKDGSQPYPYLLKDMIINAPNQAWGTDLTYIRWLCSAASCRRKKKWINLQNRCKKLILLECLISKN